MIHSWRITKSKHAGKAFSGTGAKTYGGRWNSAGIAMIYTAGSTSLVILEMLVHLQNQELLQSYVLFELEFDESFVTTIGITDLPRTWRKYPPTARLKQLGDLWVAENRSVVLCVPSVIVPRENNYLINPAHRDFAKIKINPKQPLQLDRRLTKE